MKKTLFALVFLAFPSTSQAQYKIENNSDPNFYKDMLTTPNVFTPELIKATAKRFAPVFCSQDPYDIVESIEKCYLDTPLEDKTRLQCLLADKVLLKVVIQSKKKARDTGIDSANPYADILFTQSSSFMKRDSAIEKTSILEHQSAVSGNMMYARIKLIDLINSSPDCQKKSE